MATSSRPNPWFQFPLPNSDNPIAQVFFIHGVGLIGSARAGIFVNLVPVFASIMAVTYLQESFEIFHAIALGLILGGIGLSELGKGN